VIAFMAQTTAQKGALWWAAHHRHHHRHSDTPADPHSMKIYGFWYSHIGWIVGPDFKKTDYKVIGDYAKYPELVWLNEHYLVAPTFLAVLLQPLAGLGKWRKFYGDIYHSRVEHTIYWILFEYDHFVSWHVFD
jgi:stearoyl-CoA desaturase (delta-9 desaturase)